MPEQLPANYIRIDFKDNPDLKDVFKDKTSGDKCTLTITFQIDAVTDEAATGSMEKIAPEDYEKDGEDEIKGDSAKPLMIAIIADKGSSKKSEEYADREA